MPEIFEPKPEEITTPLGVEPIVVLSEARFLIMGLDLAIHKHLITEEQKSEYLEEYCARVAIGKANLAQIRDRLEIDHCLALEAEGNYDAWIIHEQNG